MDRVSSALKMCDAAARSVYCCALFLLSLQFDALCLCQNILKHHYFFLYRGEVDKIRTLVENGVDCSLGDYDKRTVNAVSQPIASQIP